MQMGTFEHVSKFEVDEAVEKSKILIANEVKHGVEIFDPGRPTCLRPDWSKQGIGYFLL